MYKQGRRYFKFSVSGGIKILLFDVETLLFCLKIHIMLGESLKKCEPTRMVVAVVIYYCQAKKRNSKNCPISSNFEFEGKYIFLV